jgi:PilZ domain-containing protein
MLWWPVKSAVSRSAAGRERRSVTTVLLQDEPALLKGLEQTFMRRDEIRLTLVSDAPAALARAAGDPGALAVILETHDDLAPGAAAGSAGRVEPRRRCVVFCTCTPPAAHVEADQSGLPAPASGEAFLDLIRSRLGVVARQFERRVCRLHAEARAGGAVFRGVSRDLSRSGVFLVGGEPFADGEAVRVSLRAGRRGPVIEALGRVSRSIRARDGGPAAGMAVCFAPESRLRADQVDALAPRGGSA